MDILMMQNICVPHCQQWIPPGKKSLRIAKAGDYLKPMMVQCALAAIRANSLILQSNMVESKSDVDTKRQSLPLQNDDGLYLPHGFRRSPYPY